MAINSFRPYLRRSRPNKSTTSKWPKWRLFEAFSGSVEAVCPPKSGYPSTDKPQLDFECRFLVPTASRYSPRKDFLQCTIGKVCTKKTKTVASNFVSREDGDRQFRSSQNVASSIPPS